jgi:hypothetical protein
MTALALKVWADEGWRFYAAGAGRFTLLTDNPEAAAAFDSWGEAFIAWRTRVPEFTAAQIESRP